MSILNIDWLKFSETLVILLQAPLYHIVIESLLVIWVLWLIVHKSYNPRENVQLTAKEKQELIDEWKPEPLVPEYDDDHEALFPRLIAGKIGKYIDLDGQKCLNLGTHNYLGFADSEKLVQKALHGLARHGVGSCGPRAFYGTTDMHIELEQKIAQFLGVEEAILYSYGFCAVASAIPAYSKHGDIIFVDEAVCFSIQKGLDASRSHIRYFRHNDIMHLQELLEKQASEDKLKPKKSKVTRRFLVVEGIYMNTGDLCPLPEVLKLAQKYKVRLFVEESVSFGVLGSNGRGATEHFGIDPRDIDLIIANLENAAGSVGGFCAGSGFIVEHQRLSGLGYCFSASQPPLMAGAAVTAIEEMESCQELFIQLRENSVQTHKLLSDVCLLRVGGDAISPVKHLYLREPFEDRRQTCKVLDHIVKKAWEKCLALTQASYLEAAEVCLPQPSIRLIVSANLTADDINNVVNAITEICDAIMMDS